MRTKWILMAAGAACVAGAMAVCAGMGGPPRPPGGGFREPPGCAAFMLNPERVQAAGATLEQAQALREELFEQRAKSIDLRAAAEKAELALDRLMSGASVEEKAALEAADAVNQARGELFKQDLAFQIKARRILGDEVFKKIAEDKPDFDGERSRRGACSKADEEKSGERRMP